MQNNRTDEQQKGGDGMKDKKEFTDDFLNKHGELMNSVLNSPRMVALFTQFCAGYFCDHTGEKITEQKIQDLRADFRQQVIAMMLTDENSPLASEFATAIYNELRADDTDGTDTTTTTDGTEQN